MKRADKSGRAETLSLWTPAQRTGLLCLKVLKWVLLIFLTMFTLLPLVWIVISSLKTNQEIFSTAISLPRVAQWVNYQNALGLTGLGRAFLNTIFVAAVSTALCVLLSTMAAYALRHSFRWNNKTYFFLIIGMYVPVNAFMIPYFVISSVAGLYDTVWALILTYTAIGMPISVLIMKAYMDSIPQDICESAYMDGCSYHGTFGRIMLPLSMPGISTVGIFQFVTVWNEFFFATILTADESARTLQVSIRFFMGEFVVDYASAFATMVLTIAPVILMYIFFQERIISGMTSGALKG